MSPDAFPSRTAWPRKPVENGPRRAAILAGILLVLAGLAAYANTFTAPFVFDAVPIATRYPSIRHLWPIWDALSPPHDGSTVEGRPILNFSLALSYALGGTSPWAYHCLNLAIHLLAGLALFGIVRRTWPRQADPGVRAMLPALAVALLWTLHPLQTESVTYVIQRAESLMGLWYLATLYAFIRWTALGSSRAWAWLSVACCLLGMATKEVMASAPLLVLLYDRTFLAGSFREAWRRRRGYYLALASTWILLGWLAAGTGGRSGTAGLGASLPWSDYVLTQGYALARYLRLALWPHPLVFDYGATVVDGWAAVLPGALMLALLGATGVALWRRSPLGFLGAWFFAILAPTTLVPVATQTMAEHRMYLPLAAVLAGVVLGADRLLENIFRGRRLPGMVVLAGSLALAFVCATLTFRRNALYASATELWADSVAHWPGNARAHTQLGDALYRSGRIPEAAEQFRQSLLIQPAANPDAHYDLGNCLLAAGDLPGAVAELAEAARLDPGNFNPPNTLGNALLREGRVADAMEAYQAALRADPGNPLVRGNLAVACYDAGNLLARAGRIPEAIARFEDALQLNPTYPEAEDNLGSALLQAGRVEEAVAHYRAALRLRPDYPRARANLALALSLHPPAGAP